MGVTGLWKLVEPCGSPVPVETLEGKILAVDISIWLHQVVKGFQDNKGSVLPNAHLLGLFHRLCKLLYYRVRPVFVFDGCVPQLKRDTISRRQQQRSKLNNEADRIQALLLQSLAKEKVVQQALGVNAQLLIQSPIKRQNFANKESEEDDIFKLPILPDNEETDKEHEQKDASNASSLFETSTSTEDSSFDESNPRREYNANLHAIDVRSEHFKSLPPEVRHEILVDIKETRKQSSWGRLQELPSCSVDFSSFQMKRLLKRRAVQESIEETEKEMGERALTFTDLQNFFTEEGILDPENANQNSKPVCSDEAIRFTLVRDLKKNSVDSNKNGTKILEEDISPKQECKEEQIVTDNATSINVYKNKTEIANKNEQIETPIKEYDNDLERAIALSVETDDTHVYAKEDYEYESNELIRLNRHQRSQLKNTAIGPARAFMIEYGGMNDEEVERIMDKTQDCNDSEDDDFYIAQAIAASLEDMKSAKTVSEEARLNETEICNEQSEGISQEITLRVSDSSETDSDLEEVVDVTQPAFTTESKNNIEVVIKAEDQIVLEDDLFSDIFESLVEKAKEIDAKESDGKQPKLLTENVNKNITSILDELKKQADDVKNISLDDAPIYNSKPDDNSKLKNEVIEIYDSDSEKSNQQAAPNKSPNFRTPSKHKSINGYFETKYVVKRTPEKNVDEPQQTQSPHLKSPFFVKKSPSSHRKGSAGKTTKSPIHGRKLSKVSKTLFESANPSSEKELDSSPLKTKDTLEIAANTLKEQNTTEDLQNLAADLAKERRDLESERNRQDRMGTAINQNMHTECQELLKLFGIPYVIAPMEAEAQCAFLESVNLTNGTITDDSDIWLFGGRTVYKNFFEQNKHVLKFESDKIRHTFNCDREKLIQLACLVGSDYTTGKSEVSVLIDGLYGTLLFYKKKTKQGIHGIGTVTALEILAAFTATSKNSKESCTISNITTGNVLSALSLFRDWLKSHRDVAQPAGSSTRLKLRKKLKNIELNDGFPNPAVIEAYLYPKIDDSKAPFRWGYPDVQSINAFTKKIFGWTTNKTDTVLKPVLKRLSEKQSQASIRNYFTTKSALKCKELKVSKRVQKAIDTMAGVSDTIEAESPCTKPAKRSRRSKKQTEICETDQNVESDDVKDLYNPTNPVIDAPSTSAAALARDTNTINPRLPVTKEVIPQRERDLEEMRNRKAEAAVIFSKSRPVASTVKARKPRRTKQ